MAQIDPQLLDKVRRLSPYDFARLLIAILGDTTTEGIKLLGKKSDSSFENIKTDDSGRLLVYDPVVAPDVAAILALVTAINTNVGDMSADTLKSIKAKLGNNASDFWTIIGYQGATSLANKLTLARATLLDNLDALVSSRAAAGDAMTLTVATFLAIQALILTDTTPFAGADIDAAISSRAAPGAQMDLLAATITAIRQSVCAGTDPAGSIGKLLNDYLDASVSGRAAAGDAMTLTAATLLAIQALLLTDATPFAGANIALIKAQTDKIANAELETEWSSTPVTDQVAATGLTPLTAGSVTPTFPTSSTRVRVLLVASIHAANQGANTHHIGIQIQGQKTVPGGYSDLLDLTFTKPLALVNLDGSGDGWIGAIDITTLVDTSAVQYDFRFVVDSDNAGAVNYTTEFTLVLVYHM